MTDEALDAADSVTQITDNSQKFIYLEKKINSLQERIIQSLGLLAPHFEAFEKRLTKAEKLIESMSHS